MACPVPPPAPSRRRRLRPTLAAGLAALLLGGGCNPVTRHDILTFFFTGVPPLGSETPDEDEDVIEVKGQASAPGATKQPAERQRRKASVVVTATRYTHGPFAANQCYQCHQTSASGGFRGFGKKAEAQGSLAKAGAVSGNLVMPVAELCPTCHISKSTQRAYQAGLWVHGPVSSGYCVFCHSPHAGPEPAFLALKADALCLECHGDGQVSTTRKEHQPLAECLKCHNPHFGKDNRLLKTAYTEAW